MPPKEVWFGVVAVAVYGGALCCPACAVQLGWEVYGIDCLVAPARIPLVLVMVPQWWATPLFLFGVCSLVGGKPRWGLACGVAAFGLGLTFGVFGNLDNTRLGYWFWLAAMALLAASSWVTVRLDAGRPRLGRDHRKATLPGLKLLPLLLAAISAILFTPPIPADAPRPSAAALRVLDLALMSHSDAVAAEGHRGLFRVDLDSRPGDGGEHIVYDCASPTDANRTAQSSSSRRRSFGSRGLSK
jgi:hypothetical protein